MPAPPASLDACRQEAINMPHQVGWTVQQHPNRAAAHPQPPAPADDEDQLDHLQLEDQLEEDQPDEAEGTLQ